MPTLSYPELLEAEARAEARRRHPMRQIGIYLLLFSAMQYAWEMARGTGIEHLVIDHITVEPAAWLINLIWPGQNVLAQGHRLVSAHGNINVLNGCEGLETLFLLIAAFFAYPLAWRPRLLGIVLAIGLVFILNQARLAILWHAWISNPSLFGPLHGTVLPLAMIALSLLGFLAFLRWQDRNSEVE